MMARYDNDANILCLRAREFDMNTYQLIIKTFLMTQFSEEVRHKRRIQLLEK
jgi:ribose 5-phosphate isomerase RpiB